MTGRLLSSLASLAAAAAFVAAPASRAASIVDGDPSGAWPRVQRGDTDAGGGVRPTRGIAIGFEEGTVLFDADALRPVACWFGGFVDFTDQPYFGRYWARAGGEAPRPDALLAGALRVRMPGEATWRMFEPPLESDPNEGSRFEGYQIGRSAVRLRYRLRCDGVRVGVAEDVRMEVRGAWQGAVRSLSITGLPEGARVALELPGGGQRRPVAGALVWGPDEHAVVAVVRGSSEPRIERDGDVGMAVAAVSGDEPIGIRVEYWRAREPEAAVGGGLPGSSLASLVSAPIPVAVDGEPFDLSLPPAPAAALPPLGGGGDGAPGSGPPARRSPRLPAIDPARTIETFPAVTTRRLRFTIEATTGDAGAGIDELEIFGPGSDGNVALRGSASASSVIPGYPIHQVAHLNDGQHGNEHSWVAESEQAWIEIAWPEPVAIDRLVWARDRTGACRDRLATEYRIEVESADGGWIEVCGSVDHEPFQSLQAEDGYVMETIPMPFPDCRPSGIAFDSDGGLYLVAMTRGEVWRSRRPAPGRPASVRWQRFAAGLNHPIGVVVRDGRVFVAQKPEITELVDRDGDGEADHYRTVAGGWGLSQGWHEYTFGLAADDAGDLWFALNTGFFWTNPGYVNPGRLRGSILRVAPDTGRLVEVARGCRVPNGIAIGPGGGVFFTDNQGDWIQSCKLAHVVAGRFYGHPETREDALPEGRYPDGRSAVWLPYGRSRSTSGPAFDGTGGAFGPFSGQCFVGDVGYGGNPGLMRIALERIGDQWQGACFRFTDGQPLGCERLAFGPDGRLYQASLSSGLTALRFAGGEPMAIRTMRLRKGGKGFVLEFTRPLGEGVRVVPEQFRFRRYHYQYGGAYGSPEIDSRPVDVADAVLSDDRRTVTLTLPVESHPNGMVYELTMDPLAAADGRTPRHPEAWYTVQRLP